MCDDFGSDSGGFDDVGSSDFDSDIGSDFDSDISSDFDTDFSSDIDSMDFDDVDIDFDDDIGSDFDTSDYSDDIDSMDFDDVDSLDFDSDIGDDFDSDIEAIDIDDGIESLDFDEDIETLDIDDDIETLDIDDDIETIDIDDDIETLDIDDNIETIDIEDDIEAIDIDDDIEAIDIDDNIETIDIDDDIETIDIEDDVDVSELGEDIEDMNMEDISEDAFEIEEGFDDSEPDIAEEADFEAEIAEMEAEESDFESEIDSMEFDDEAEAMDMAEEFEDIDEAASDDISEDFDFDNEIEDIDISEDIEAMDLDDIAEGEETDTPDSFEDMELINPEETEFITPEGPEFIYPDAPEFEDEPLNEASPNTNDVAEEILTDLEAINSNPGDIPTYTDADEGNIAPEAIDWDSMLSDGDRDYINGIMTNDNYTPEQKDYLVREALGEIYERETTEPEYGARVRALTYDGRDIITRPPDDYNSEVYSPAEVAESINDAPVNEYNEPFSGELSEQDFDTIYDGLDEYDFHGVDCLENPERLDASLENFTSENWENLSLEEQKDQMTDLAQYIIDVTGLENPPTIEFYNSGKDGDYGGFNRATNTLSINEHMLYQNDEAADTVAHELWHAYQYERASNPSTKLDHMYLENFNDYITPDDDFEGYQSQILESEARAFAQQIKDRLHSY